jgi:hypothetical protein
VKAECMAAPPLMRAAKRGQMAACIRLDDASNKIHDGTTRAGN